MGSIFPSRLIKYNLQTQYDFFRNSIDSRKYSLNLKKIFDFKCLANGSKGNEKFEESWRFKRQN